MKPTLNLLKNLGGVVCAATFFLVGGIAHAELLWYNGDFNGANGLANERNSSISQASVYDDFIVPTGGWTLDSLFSNDLMSFTATSADWSIRTGVSSGNGGTIVYSGTASPATVAPTGRGGFGYTEFTIQVSGLSLQLDAGTYWLNVTPVGSGGGRSFDSTTSGVNAAGNPLGNDGNAFFDSSSFSRNFTTAGSEIGGSPDFSMGVSGTAGTLSITPVPEPVSLALPLFGVLFAGASRFLTRSKATTQPASKGKDASEPLDGAAVFDYEPELFASAGNPVGFALFAGANAAAPVCFAQSDDKFVDTMRLEE